MSATLLGPGAAKFGITRMSSGSAAAATAAPVPVQQAQVPCLSRRKDIRSIHYAPIARCSSCNRLFDPSQRLQTCCYSGTSSRQPCHGRAGRNGSAAGSSTGGGAATVSLCYSVIYLGAFVGSHAHLCFAERCEHFIRLFLCFGAPGLPWLAWLVWVAWVVPWPAPIL